MTPPGDAGAGANAGAAAAPAVLSWPGPAYRILRKRADFLRAASARRQSTPGFLLQARDRGKDGGGEMRLGFTCSKKVGNAVARNRAKRRLREIARLELPGVGRPGWDYVLVGRREVTAERDFEELRRDLKRALAKIHEGRK